MSLKETLRFLFLIIPPLHTYSQEQEPPRKKKGRHSETNKIDEMERRQGLWVYYYQPGIIRLEANYVNNLLEGSYKKYDWGYKITEECNYLAGKRDGDYKKYFISGQVATEGKFDFGKRDGKWIDYYETGQIKREREYKKGVMEGQWKVYNRKGDIISDITYKNGLDVNAAPPPPPVAKPTSTVKGKNTKIPNKILPKDTSKTKK